jgi:hypothetical protein
VKLFGETPVGLSRGFARTRRAFQALESILRPAEDLKQAIFIAHSLKCAPTISQLAAHLTTVPAQVKFYCVDAGW